MIVRKPEDVHVHTNQDAKNETATDAPAPAAPLWLLALITLSGTLAMHIFVPALPIAARDLGASQSSMQLTISLYIFGLAVGQLIYGPVSDRLGRRPTLLAGLALYALSGLAAAVAPDGASLIAARLFQALGGCSGLVLGRAILRDVAGPYDTARRLASMNLMVTLGPAIAPMVGNALASTTWGWRSIFVVLAALGVCLIVLTWRLLPETGGREGRSDLQSLGRDYRSLLVSPAFCGFALGGGCATTAMYAFIASAPFIFTRQLHRPVGEVAYFLPILIAGIWLGSALTSRLVARLPLGRVLVGANLLSVFAAFVLLGATLLGQLTVAITMASMFVFTLGAGIASPAALTQAVSVNPKVIGSAAGLYGFAQMAVGAACTALAGLGTDPALAAALVLSGAGIIAQLSFWAALRK
jgi:MFS transporter, DHA1 family, multidrug resistance protein